MGLKTTTPYTIEKIDITIPEAYAKIDNISITESGEAHATFNIQQNRQDAISKRPIDTVHFSTVIDKDEPVYSQIYTKAKEEVFVGWIDDIVEE